MSERAEGQAKFKAARRAPAPEPEVRRKRRRPSKPWRVIAPVPWSGGGEWELYRAVSREACERWIEKEVRSFSTAYGSNKDEPFETYCERRMAIICEYRIEGPSEGGPE